MHVLVIGAGVQGIATSYFLQRNGAEVTVVDRAEGPGLEASWGNGGILHASIPPPWNEPGSFRMMLKSLLGQASPIEFHLKALPSLVCWGLKFLTYAKDEIFLRNTLRNVRLSYFSLKMLDELQQDTQIDYRGSDTGLLKVFRDEAAQEGLVRFADCLVSEGVEYQSLDVKQTIALEPSLKPVADKITGGVYLPKDGSGDSHLFCKNLAKVTVRRGVDHRYNSEIDTLTKSGKLFEVRLVDGEKLKADAVVVAAGSYSPKLVKSLGIDLPIRPAKGYSFTLPISDWQQKPRIPIIDTGLLVGCTPLGGEQLRIGGGAEFAGYDKSISDRCINTLLGQLEGVFPEFAPTVDRNNLQPWAGFRPISVDGVPIIGKTKVDNLYINAGQGYLGWTMAAGSGRLVADQVMGHKPQLAMEDYSIARF